LHPLKKARLNEVPLNHYSPIAHRTAFASSKARYFKIKFESRILFTTLKNFSNNKRVFTLAE
jgi:hypothetical protein